MFWGKGNMLSSFANVCSPRAVATGTEPDDGKQKAMHTESSSKVIHIKLKLNKTIVAKPVITHFRKRNCHQKEMRLLALCGREDICLIDLPTTQN